MLERIVFYLSRWTWICSLRREKRVGKHCPLEKMEVNRDGKRSWLPCVKETTFIQLRELEKTGLSSHICAD